MNHRQQRLKCNYKKKHENRYSISINLFSHVIYFRWRINYTAILTPGEGGGGGGGGGHSGTEGGRTRATYFAEEGVFFLDLRMSAIL